MGWGAQQLTVEEQERLKSHKSHLKHSHLDFNLLCNLFLESDFS